LKRSIDCSDFERDKQNPAVRCRALGHWGIGAKDSPQRSIAPMLGNGSPKFPLRLKAMRTLFVISIFFLLTSSIFADTYYVAPAPDGDNGNDGLSESNAWETLEYSFSQLSAGDTLYVRGGSYYESHVYVRCIGT